MIDEKHMKNNQKSSCRLWRLESTRPGGPSTTSRLTGSRSASFGRWRWRSCFERCSRTNRIVVLGSVVNLWIFHYKEPDGSGVWARCATANEVMWWVQLHFARTWLWCNRLHTRFRIEQFIYLNFMFSFFAGTTMSTMNKKTATDKKHCVMFRRTINVRLHGADSCRSDS